MTGFGLASAAGLNAYIPLLSMGLLDRYTSLVNSFPAVADTLFQQAEKDAQERLTRLKKMAAGD